MKKLFNNCTKLTLLCALAHSSALAQQLVITSFQGNGQLTWTNLAGTNAFVVQWTPNLTGSWSNAPAPLDLTVSTNTQTTVSVSIVPPTSFYRLVEGFSLQSLHGTWMILPAGVTNAGMFYFMSDGNGVLTTFSEFNAPTPPGAYSVNSTGGLTLFIRNGSKTNTVICQFMPPRQFAPIGSSFFGIAKPVQDPSLCAGTWSGTLSETNDPNGLASYPINLTVAANGAVNLTNIFSGTGGLFALASANGATSGFFTNTIYPSSAYDQISISGTLNGNVISGSFTTDSGSGANAVSGTVTLIR